ncbi:MAG TPA: DUF305 domain-containing protein [Gemmatimonadaceae bacterium]|nr:DUF305 domain-containing protein [Gemmatimonadaceae bacterium]
MRRLAISSHASVPKLLAMIHLIAAIAPVACRDQQPATSESHAPFAAATNRMMSAMEIEPSGDADRDFVEMMVPHHQGAIDMARAELRYGRNEQLRRIAQEIIVTQQQEIAAMRLAIRQPLAASESPSGQEPPP